MNRLNNAVVYPSGRAPRPERVLQFGEGVFLRAFIGDLFDDLSGQGLFDGGVAVVQPRPGAGKLDALNAQDGLYTLILRGLSGGERVERMRLIRCVTRGVNPYEAFDAYLSVIESPALRFVVSNTTEAGIAYRAEPLPADAPPLGFPAKVAQLLYRRYRRFGGDVSKGLIFLPCELIEHNGAELKRIVRLHARDWALGEDFEKWLETSCVFADTLVDRIVSGYPGNEAEALAARLGYEDHLLDVAEPYSLFAIAGAPGLKQELPVDKAALNVVLTDDLASYRTRKVRILNGAHTALTPSALLMGKRTVGESMADPLLRRYLTRLIHEEVIPAMDGDAEALTAYAADVFERFDDPFLQHALTGIALNATSKWRARLLPSLRDYVAKKGCNPPLIAFSFAAALELRREEPEGVADSDCMETLYAQLRQSPGFGALVERARQDIREKGCARALEERL